MEKQLFLWTAVDKKEAANILQQKNTVINLGYGKNISKNILTKAIQTVLQQAEAFSEKWAA